MLLKKLTSAMGLPGFEDDIRNIIQDEIKDYVDKMYVDNLGNLIAVKNENMHGKHIVLSAHMDEVGLIVRGISSEGLIYFSSWGVDERALVAKSVKVGLDGVHGVIGSKPVHLQNPDEREKPIPIRSLYVDIGCNSKEETEKYVSVGDFIGFDSEFVQFGQDNQKVKAKALDNRVGCALIIRILQSGFMGKVTAVFNVQEEIGLRGSSVSANQVFADIVLNFEGTLCMDTADVDEHLRITEQGKGAAISILDGRSVFNRKYIDDIIKVAEINGIPYQFRKAKAGSTDAASFHVAHKGTPVIGVSVPCRYIHTPVSVLDLRDYENMYRLIECYMNSFYKEEV